MMKISKVRAVLMGVALAATGFCANAQVIGLSNGYFGTEWRNQMIDGAKEQFAMYKAKGMATGLVIQQSGANTRSEEHTSELQSLMRISYAVFCLKKKNTNPQSTIRRTTISRIHHTTLYHIIRRHLQTHL